MNKKIIIGIIVVVVFGAGFWFTQRQPQSQKYTGPIEKVTLGAESSLLPGAVWVAESKGYFREQGLDLTIKDFDSGRLSLSAMLRGEVDISTAAPTPIMFNSFDRNDFSYFATFASSNEDIKLTVRKDRGINTATDLKGKKIGTAVGTTGQFVVDVLLVLQGIQSSDVEVVNFAPSDLPDAINNGEVDAIVIWEPHGNNARRLLGDKAIILPISDVYTTTFNFLVRNDFAKDNPQILVRFLRAIDKATEFIRSNEEESQLLIATRLNVEKEDVELFWDEFTFEISMNQAWLLNIESEARWAIKNKLTDATDIPNYLDYIYTDALEAVKPDVMTIIK